MIEASAPQFRGRTHIFPVRVYYEDTDAGGVVYYASYLKFAERARTEMARALGVNQVRLLDEDGVFFAVRQCLADYLLPARHDDLVMVESRVGVIGGASMAIAQRIRRDGQDLVRLRVRLACVGRSGRATRWPDAVRAAFATLVNLDDQEERWTQP
jgi:acyl-CoA thioester hydrolase